MKAYIQIDRCEPSSRDASYSTRGHHPRLTSPTLTSEEAITAYIWEHAPETDNKATTIDLWPELPGARVIITARDGFSGHFTTIYIQRYA